MITNPPHTSDKTSYAHRLITALGSDSDMIKGVMSTPPRNGGNGVIKIELQSIELKIRCLKNKESLRHTAEFKKVYIHSSKPNGERVSEMNFKTLLSVIPGGDQYRVTGNGRIIPKVQHEHMHRPDPQPDVRPRNRVPSAPQARPQPTYSEVITAPSQTINPAAQGVNSQPLPPNYSSTPINNPALIQQIQENGGIFTTQQLYANNTEPNGYNEMSQHPFQNVIAHVYQNPGQNGSYAGNNK